MYNWKNDITFQTISDMISICEPLLQCFKIHYFTFDKVYQDGSSIRLTTHGNWIEHYYTNELYRKAAFDKDPKHYKNGFALWLNLGREPVYSAAYEFNIDNGITLIQTQQNSCEFFHFSGTPQQQYLNNFYIENIHLLERFIYYFKEKAALMIKLAEANRIYLPRISSEFNTFDEQQKLFICDIAHLNSHDMGEDFILHSSLTPKQREVINWLRKGKTALEISIILKQSVRTIEMHINHIKMKLKCKTLFQLGKKLADYQII